MTYFNTETLKIAKELQTAGISIYIPKNNLMRTDNKWFQFRHNGLLGYYDGNSFDHNWSMPIKPSREHGSSMWVAEAENANTCVDSAYLILRQFNSNELVGRHENYASEHSLNNYVLIEI